jgi:hypothetical protein
MPALRLRYRSAEVSSALDRSNRDATNSVIENVR